MSEKNNYAFKVAWCPVCDQGWVEVVKECGSKHLFLRCTECEMNWDNFESFSSGMGMFHKYGLVEDPTVDEVKEIGWDKYILKN